MSRGFVKEDDQEEPPFIPPRASLPEGVENYVTADGLRELKEERKTLIESRKNSNSLSERDRRREQTIIDTQINQLDERIQSAKVVEPLNNPSQVRFGTTVSFVNTKTPANVITFKIVGVDEANIRQAKVAFTAPLVKAMMGKQVGDPFDFDREGDKLTYSIKKIL